MTDTIDLRPSEIANLARKQLLGSFSVQSDAMFALSLIEALASRLADLNDAPGRGENP